LGINDATEWELAVVILMIYPSFGPSSGKEENIKKPFNKDTKVFRLLQDEGMLYYKGTITDNNNEDLRDEFFKTSIIVRLWNEIAKDMTLKDFFDE
jgi:hypothetical protein